MASITYTALRNMEATGYAIVGTDISAANGDQSFNSVSTGMAGLEDDEWVYVAGFANDENNGWFQADGDSVLHKVTQDSSASIITEAAGNSVTLTGYVRGSGNTYAIDFDVEQGDRENVVKRSVRQPMGGGAPEIMTYRDESMITVRTSPIYEVDIKQWREFLASVQGGELFTFDRYGTNASPVEAETVYLISESYKEMREGPNYPGRYRLQFQVRVIS